MDNVEGDPLEAELGSRQKRADGRSDFSQFLSDDMEEQNNFNAFIMAEEPT